MLLETTMKRKLNHCICLLLVRSYHPFLVFRKKYLYGYFPIVYILNQINCLHCYKIFACEITTETKKICCIAVFERLLFGFDCDNWKDMNLYIQLDIDGIAEFPIQFICCFELVETIHIVLTTSGCLTTHSTCQIVKVG